MLSKQNLSTNLSINDSSQYVALLLFFVCFLIFCRFHNSKGIFLFHSVKCSWCETKISDESEYGGKSYVVELSVMWGALLFSVVGFLRSSRKAENLLDLKLKLTGFLHINCRLVIAEEQFRQEFGRFNCIYYHYLIFRDLDFSAVL